MEFYKLSKSDRHDLVKTIYQNLLHDFIKSETTYILLYFSDTDTYIRKSAYIATGRIYFTHLEFQKQIPELVHELLENSDFKVRQTAVNAAGEIGRKDFEEVEKIMHQALFDEHHSVRNAVIGSIKKMGQKNPIPVLNFAKQFLQHPNKEIRREICHGIELRGRTHPQDILPLLRELELDKTSRVRNTLIHVLGQIAYKKGCLEIVVEELKHWNNKELVKAALHEIMDVHERYKNFAVKTQAEAEEYIRMKIGL
jgi:HEAT repeats